MTSDADALLSALSGLSNLKIASSRIRALDGDGSNLGTGGFGIVVLGMLDEKSDRCQRVAIKKLSKKIPSPIQLRLAHEVNIWARAKHPNILELLGFCYSPSYSRAQIISPYMSNGSVKAYLDRMNPGSSNRLHFVRGITSAMTYLHSLDPPISHGDLKPANILVSQDLDALLCDFGHAVLLNTPDAQDIEFLGTPGTIRYMSPELFYERNTQKSDVWAWGCTAYEILTGSMPYAAARNDISVFFSQTQHISPGSMGRLFDSTSGYHPGPVVWEAVRTSISKSWKSNPHERPRFSEIGESIISCGSKASYDIQRYDSESSVKDGEDIHSEKGNASTDYGNATTSFVQPGVKLSDPNLSPQLEGAFTFPALAHLREPRGAIQAVWTRLDGSKMDVAVRYIRYDKDERNQNNVVQRISNRMPIWQSARHPNLHGFMGYSRDEEGIAFLVSGWCYQGTLKQYIITQEVGEMQKIRLLCDVASGLAYLHSLEPPIIHGGVHPENVMILDTLEAALCDIAVYRLAQNQTTITRAAPFKAGDRYVAPDELSSKGDIYAFGSLILATMSGKEPHYKQTTQGAVMMAIIRGDKIFPQDYPLLPENHYLWSLLRSCRRQDPDERPSMKTVVEKLLHILASPEERWIDEDSNESNSIVQPGRVILDKEIPSEIEGKIIKENTAIDGGQYADVFRASRIFPDGSTTHVAVKSIRRRPGIDKERMTKRIKRETVIWQAATHPNILKYLGYKMEGDVIWLVSPFCEHGNLASYIARNPQVGAVRKLSLLCGAGQGLIHLHSLTPPIAHADIKPENVLVMNNLEAALCDFGVAKVVSEYGVTSGMTTTGNMHGGTTGYQARETLNGELSSPASDVYSFGGLILAAMSGKRPFWEMNGEGRVLLAIIGGRTPDPARHSNLPPDDPLWPLMGQCWMSNPKDRPTMETVVDELTRQRGRRLRRGGIEAW